VFDTSWVEAQQRFNRRLLWTAGGLLGALVALILLYSVWPRRVRGFLYADGTCSATAAGTVVADRNRRYEMSQPSRSVVELACGNVRLVIGLHPDTGLVVGTYPFRAAKARWQSMWGRLRVDRLERARPVGSFTFWARRRRGIAAVQPA
jgi:hypothetical protein